MWSVGYILGYVLYVPGVRVCSGGELDELVNECITKHWYSSMDTYYI